MTRYLIAASVPIPLSRRHPIRAYSDTLISSRPRKNEANALEAARMQAPRAESRNRKKIVAPLVDAAAQGRPGADGGEERCRRGSG